MQAVLLLSVVLYMALAEKLGRHEPKDVKQMQMILMIVAAAQVAAILIARQRMLPPAEDVLRTRPDDVVALLRWRAANILTLVLAESVVLYGFVLQIGRAHV